MATTSELGSAMPSNGLGAWVARAAAVRATSVVTTCMVGAWASATGIVIQDAARAQQLEERMKALLAKHDQLNREIRIASRKRARFLAHARGLHREIRNASRKRARLEGRARRVIRKVVEKQDAAPPRAAAKAKAKAAAQVRIAVTFLFGIDSETCSIASMGSSVVDWLDPWTMASVANIYSCCMNPHYPQPSRIVASISQHITSYVVLTPRTPPSMRKSGSDTDCAGEIVLPPAT